VFKGKSWRRVERGQAFVGWLVIVDREQVWGAALPAASSPLRRYTCADAPRRRAAGGGDRDRLVAGGNSTSVCLEGV